MSKPTIQQIDFLDNNAPKFSWRSFAGYHYANPADRVRVRVHCLVFGYYTAEVSISNESVREWVRVCNPDTMGIKCNLKAGSWPSWQQARRACETFCARRSAGGTTATRRGGKA